MVAQLPQNCFDLVVHIEKNFLAGELRNATKAPRITQSFFKFLVGKSTHECYELLRSVRDGEKTSTELNYVPTGKVNSIFLTVNICMHVPIVFVLFADYIKIIPCLEMFCSHRE